MKNYHGIIVDVSQKEQSIFNRLKILSRKIDGDWTLYKIELSPKEKDPIINELQKNLIKGFYFHIYKDNELIAVFKDKIFKVKTDKSTWKEIIEYGKSINILEEQLDFSPCKIKDETY